MMRTGGTLALLALGGLSAGCAPAPRPPVRAVPAAVTAPAPLPPLSVETAPATGTAFVAPGPYDIADPLAHLPLGEPLTLSSTAVSVPALLIALGEAVGISLVLDPEIAGVITVNFQEVPAREALRIVLEQAGLFISAGPPEVPWAPVVFYAIPIDIDAASVETIQARFGVSRTLAEFLVRNRVRP